MSVTALPRLRPVDPIGRPSSTNDAIGTNASWPSFAPEPDEQRKDYFAGQGEHAYAGRHLILDLWGGKGLDDLGRMERTLRDAVTASGATLLHIHLHHFTPNDGISGVAVLAESHISVHTWPERDYAAFDIFMCGDALPEKAVEVIKNAFQPERTDLHSLLRGRVDIEKS
jgi:S-adenosylmethionine decarboxylase